MLGHRLGTTITAVAFAALTPLLACGGDDDASGTTTTDTPQSTDAPTTTLSPEEQTKADVRAAYDAYWAMFERLTSSPDPADPEIDQLAAGDVRNDLVDSLSTLQAQGMSLRFGPQHGHTILDITLEGDAATVRSCSVDDGARVSANGDEQSSGLSTSIIVASLSLADAQWRVQNLTEGESWDGVHDCST